MITTCAVVEVLYLDSLSVVGLHNMEVEAVHSSPWCQEDTALLVEMCADIHQNLIRQMTKDINSKQHTHGMADKKKVTGHKQWAYCQKISQ